jgi:hypothetical protein
MPVGGFDRWESGQHVLAVDQIDLLALDDVREDICECWIQPFILEVVPDVGQRRRRKAELEYAKPIVLALTTSGRPAGSWLRHDH